MDKALNSSVKMDWQTPDSFLALVRQVDDIALDPCTVADNPTSALHFFTPEENGLAQSWDTNWPGWVHPVGLVYVNPPYGRELPKWVDKCIHESFQGAEIVLLAPSRTDTNWWQTAYRVATSTLLWRGRLKFKGATASAPFPSAVFYFGQRPEVFRSAFDARGVFI